MNEDIYMFVRCLHWVVCISDCDDHWCVLLVSEDVIPKKRMCVCCNLNKLYKRKICTESRYISCGNFLCSRGAGFIQRRHVASEVVTLSRVLKNP